MRAHNGLFFTWNNSFKHFYSLAVTYLAKNTLIEGKYLHHHQNVLNFMGDKQFLCRSTVHIFTFSWYENLFCIFDILERNNKVNKQNFKFCHITMGRIVRNNMKI